MPIRIFLSSGLFPIHSLKTRAICRSYFLITTILRTSANSQIASVIIERIPVCMIYVIPFFRLKEFGVPFKWTNDFKIVEIVEIDNGTKPFGQRDKNFGDHKSFE